MFCSTDDPDASKYLYSITSLADKRDFLQKGDAVKFRVALNPLTNEKRALHVSAVRQFIRAKVESVKDKVSQWFCLSVYQKTSLSDISW